MGMVIIEFGMEPLIGRYCLLQLLVSQIRIHHRFHAGFIVQVIHYLQHGIGGLVDRKAEIMMCWVKTFLTNQLQIRNCQRRQQPSKRQTQGKPLPQLNFPPAPHQQHGNSHLQQKPQHGSQRERRGCTDRGFKVVKRVDQDDVIQRRQQIAIVFRQQRSSHEIQDHQGQKNATGQLGFEQISQEKGKQSDGEDARHQQQVKQRAGEDGEKMDRLQTHPAINLQKEQWTHRHHTSQQQKSQTNPLAQPFYPSVFHHHSMTIS